MQTKFKVDENLPVKVAEIGAYPPKDFSGFIVLRLKMQDKRHVIKVINRLMKMFPVEKLEQRLWIVDENRIRVRE